MDKFKVQASMEVASRSELFMFSLQMALETELMDLERQQTSFLNNLKSKR
jgi:hypothetical protein